LKESSQSQAEDIAGRITESVGQAFRTHFSNVLVPSFERALQSMFTQIANTLEQGIQQYTAQLAAASVSASSGGSSSSNLASSNATTQLGTAVTTLVDISERMNRSLVDTQSKLVSTLLDVVGRARSASGSRSAVTAPATKPPATIAAPAVTPVSGVVAPEKLVTAPRTKSTTPKVDTTTPPFPEAVQPPAPQPAPAPAPQAKTLEEIAAELQKAVTEEKFDEAITLSLSARNLDLVQSVCTILDPKKEDIIPRLSQRVLISLIQQLSADLSANTLLKLEWIHIATPLIDVADSIIAPHVGKVLGKLHQTLEGLMSTYEKSNVTLFNLIRGTLIHTKAHLRKVAAAVQSISN
jgi:hypothetical protein